MNIQKGTSNIKLVVFFVGLVVALLLVSAIVKIALLAANSRVDGNHRFTIVVFNTQDAKNTAVVSLSPETKEISYLQLSGKIPGAEQKQKITFLRHYLEVPIDSYITENYSYQEAEGDDTKIVTDRASRWLFSFATIKSDLTIFDTLRLYLYAKSVPAHDVLISDEAITPAASILDLTTLDRRVAQLFTDQTISGEKMSVQIINGTDTLGLGTRMARLVGNMGADVVSVTSSDNTQSYSSITSNNPTSYTTTRLAGIFGFPVVPMQKKGISDIILLLGTDQLKQLPY